MKKRKNCYLERPLIYIGMYRKVEIFFSQLIDSYVDFSDDYCTAPEATSG